MKLVLKKKANGQAFLADFTLGRGGDNMKLLWLLVGGTVKRCGAEQSHVIGLRKVGHQIGDKPLRG